MERKEQIRLLKEVMRRLDEGTNVDAGGILHNPTWVYTSPDLARREWETFYRSHPQAVGCSGDLPGPGSFLTTRDFGTPVLATRDADGAFRAFVNVCRHRGVLPEADDRGTRSRFTCPFHAWTYSNTGALVGIPRPDHFGKIDKDCHGLVPLPAVERFGFLWVHPQPDGELDVDALLGGLAPEFAAWNWEGLENFGYDTYEVRLNWKLAIDTFGETYHFTALHKNSLAITFYGNVQAYDTYGRNHRMTLVMKSIDELRSRPEETWHISDGTFPVYYTVAARSQIGAESGVPAFNVFGRNEPALHHYHNTYRQVLGMEPPELLKA